VSNGERPRRPNQKHGLSDLTWTLVQMCWHQEPEKRPSITSVLEKMLDNNVVHLTETETPPDDLAIAGSDLSVKNDVENFEEGTTFGGVNFPLNNDSSRNLITSHENGRGFSRVGPLILPPKKSRTIPLY